MTIMRFTLTVMTSRKKVVIIVQITFFYQMEISIRSICNDI